MEIRYLLWSVFVGGFFTALYFGRHALLAYCATVVIAIALFRRPLVIWLTHLASKLGLMRGTISRMPVAIHLVRAPQPAEAALPTLEALAGNGFLDAGAWDIVELPGIKVALLVRPAESLLAAVETASSIGAQLNLHTLYPDGRVVTFTNSELPASKVQRPNVTQTRVPRASAETLLECARQQRPGRPFAPVSVAEAPRVYEQLYADEIRFRKERGA